jgi:branched-subunit amino acid ABC-type transport system permease component
VDASAVHQILGTPIGGISGEFARYLPGAVPPSAPTSLGWRVLGAVGLGGAAGVAAWVVLGLIIGIVQLWFEQRRPRSGRHFA